MGIPRSLAASPLFLILTACGEPTVIDVAKAAHVSECPGAVVGDTLNNYFPTTSWTAYNGEEPGTFMIHGEGELQYVGATQTAVLRFVLDEESGAVTYDGLTLHGVEQPSATAQLVLKVMCDDARD